MSALPASFGFSTAITLPMPGIPAAPVSWIAAAMAASTSASDIACGMYACSTPISNFSASARSCRPPCSNCSIESRRCLIILSMTAITSASASSSRSSTSRCLTAASSSRSASRRRASAARIAVLTSSLIFAFRDTGGRESVRSREGKADGAKCCPHDLRSHGVSTAWAAAAASAGVCDDA